MVSTNCLEMSEQYVMWFNKVTANQIKTSLKLKKQVQYWGKKRLSN